jgi:hypothetical protein
MLYGEYTKTLGKGDSFEEGEVRNSDQGRGAK